MSKSNVTTEQLETLLALKAEADNAKKKYETYKDELDLNVGTYKADNAIIRVSMEYRDVLKTKQLFLDYPKISRSEYTSVTKYKKMLVSKLDK